MTNSKIIKYSDDQFERPIAIIGFPGVGLVSSIVTSFIAKELNMTTIAGISSPLLPPYTLIQNGIPLPPIRIYGCKGVDIVENCKDIVVVTSEVTPKPEDSYEISMSVLEVLEELKISDAIILEGVPAMEENQKIFICGSPCPIKERLEKMGIEPLNEGIIRGMSGIMLYEGTFKNINIVTLLCPANSTLPDPRSAAAILKPLSELIPSLKLDFEPLYKEAEDIDKRFKEQERDTENSSQNLYG